MADIPKVPRAEFEAVVRAAEDTADAACYDTEETGEGEARVCEVEEARLATAAYLNP